MENTQFMGKSGSHCMFAITAVSAHDTRPYSAMGSHDREFVLLPDCCLVVEDILDAGATELCTSYGRFVCVHWQKRSYL